MKLINLEMNNFRQYRDKAIINFSNGHDNITLITGQNGKGKTGIYRALMFALYGMTHIEQDNKKDQIILGNRYLLDKYNRASVSVSVTFEHNNNTYKITRNIESRRAGDKYHEQIKDVVLEKFNIDTKLVQKYTNDKEISVIISSLLSEDIKDFFLFDGEKIDTLVKTDAAYKKEVQTAIVKLLQIEVLTDTEKFIRDFISLEEKHLAARSENINAKSIADKLNIVKGKIDQKNHLLTKLTEKLVSSNNEVSNMNMLLEQDNEIYDLKAELDIVELNLKYLEEEKNKNNQFLTTTLNKSKDLLMENAYISAREHILSSQSDIREFIPQEILNFSIKSGRCACCNNDLTTHNENMDFVHTLMRKMKGIYRDTFSNELVNQYTSIIENSDQIRENIQNDISKANEIIERINGFKLQSTFLDSKLTELSNKNIDLLDVKQTRDKEIQDIGMLKAKIEELKDSLIELKKDEINLLKEFEKVVKQEKTIEKEVQMLAYANKVRSKLNSISKEFSNEARVVLNEMTTSIFSNLIDEKDKNLIRNVNINEKFEIILYGYDGVEITQDISQGQRHIMSLSFILALALLASGHDNTIDYPLFMDSPFNRLSVDNKANLIRYIPRIANQWILLLTDSELSSKEVEEFKKTQKVGKVYYIEQVDTYIAEIVESTLNNPFIKKED